MDVSVDAYARFHENKKYTRRDKADPQLSVCTSLADGYDAQEATKDREIEGRC